MAIDRRKYLYRIKRLEIKSWLKYLMIEGKSVVDYVLGELASGTDITIDNTVEKKFYKFDVKGNSVQETTTGYQLLNLEDGTLTDQGVTRIIDNGKIILNGTPTSDSYNKPLYTFTAPQTGNYVLLPFKSSTNSNIRFIYQINGGTWISNDTSNEISLSQGDVLKINLRISATTSINNFTLSPLLYLGNYDESKKWEEYTGGIASPNPSYPQPILSSGDNGSISEKIVNKNLFDINTIIRGYELNSNTGNDQENANWWLSDYIVIKPNTTYISSNISSSTKCWYDSDKNFISRVQAITGTSPANAKYLRVNGTLASLQTNPNLQIEQGLTATTYVAHQEQTYTIPVQQPMRSIGTVRDEFIQINGEWKERHNIASIILNGSEIWTSASTSDDYYYFYSQTYDSSIATTYKCLCDKFVDYGKQMVASSVVTSDTISVGGSQFAKIRIKILKTRLTGGTSAIFKTWLSTALPELCYELATPTDLPCTDEQIAILENLPKSYNEQTNIYSIDTTPAFLEVQAYVKKEEVIEND